MHAFLTDGEHNVGEYEQGHMGGRPPTSSGWRSAAAASTPSAWRIASETGGRYFADTDAHELQRVLNAIDSRLNCDIDVDNFDTVVDLESERDEEQEFEADLSDSTESADVIVGWTTRTMCSTLASWRSRRGRRRAPDRREDSPWRSAAAAPAAPR